MVLIISWKMSLSIYVEPSCLVCCKNIKKQLATDNTPINSAPILSDLLKLFCKHAANLLYVDVVVDRNISSYSFDFTHEPFPFCNPCKLQLVTIFKLNEQVESLQKQIQAVSSNLAAIVIESLKYERINTSNPNCSQDLITGLHRNFTYGETTRRKIITLRQHIRNHYSVKIDVPILKISDLKIQQATPSETIMCPKPKPGPKSKRKGGIKNLKETTLITSESKLPLPQRDPISTSIPRHEIENSHIVIEVETEPLNLPGDKNISCNRDENSGEKDDEVNEIMESEIPRLETSDSPATIMGNDLDPDYVPSSGSRSPNENNSSADDKDDDNDSHLTGTGSETKLNDKVRNKKSLIKPTHSDAEIVNNKTYFTGTTSKRCLPLFFNRTIEYEPNQFVYGNKYRFEKLENGEYECKTCPYTDLRKDKILYHIRYKHCFISRFTCEVCDKSFSHKVHLLSHQQSHKDAINNPVPDLQGSRSRSSSPLPYNCPKCGKSFKTAASLHFHKTHHNCNNDYEFECDEPNCKKKIFSLALLEEHKIIHKRPFKCTVCSKTFGYKKGLKHHLKVHNGTQSHFCPESKCISKFRRRYQLEEHMKTVHKKNLPPRTVSREKTTNRTLAPGECRCNECGRVFKSQSLLSAHETIHIRHKFLGENEKLKYKCSYCTMSFKGKKNLKEHEIIHTDLLPFSCSHCGKKTRKFKNLKSHIQSVHPELVLTHESSEDEGDNPDESLPVT